MKEFKVHWQNLNLQLCGPSGFNKDMRGKWFNEVNDLNHLAGCTINKYMYLRVE
jgi:hypothetical protein